MNVLLGIAVITFFISLLCVFLYYRNVNKNKKDYSPQSVLNTIPEGKRGDAKTCPICAARFENGETVKSKIFPPTGRFDRLLHISGCPFCINGERERLCPVCKAKLSKDDYLVARIFRRPGKDHVHVQGCPHCLVKKQKNNKNMRLLFFVLIFSACGTLQKQSEIEKIITDDIELLPSGAQIYAALDVNKSRALLDSYLSLNNINNNNIKLFLDKSVTAVLGLGYSNTKRYMLVSSGKNYPVGGANLSFAFGKGWKKKTSANGKSYWHNDKSKMSISLEQKRAYISDSDPFSLNNFTICPQEYKTFSKDAAVTVWAPNASPIKILFAVMDIPVNLPINELFVGIFPEDDQWNIMFLLQTPSPSQARALSSMLNIARKNKSIDTFKIKSAPMQIIADIFLNASPAIENSSLVLRADKMTTDELIAIMTAILSKN